MASTKIRVTIVDDHQSIVDGYRFRLQGHPQVEVVASTGYGEEVEPVLKAHPTDVLLLDVNLPTSADNSNTYPILHVIPNLLQRYPEMAVLVISMYNERGLVRAVMEAGANGYILKDDSKTIQDLGNIIVSVAKNGGIFLSEKVHHALFRTSAGTEETGLSIRQLEVLSLSASYPNSTTGELATKMGVSNSTVRNLLSGAYLKLEVNTRAAAIARGRQLGIIPSDLSAPTVPRKSTQN